MTAVVKKTTKKRVGDGSAGPGRPKGSQNKITKQVKDMVIEALSKAGGVTYLRDKAKTHPAAFLTLVGKVIPLQVAGDPNAPMVVQVIQVTSEGEQEAAWRKP